MKRILISVLALGAVFTACNSRPLYFKRYFELRSNCDEGVKLWLEYDPDPDIVSFSVDPAATPEGQESAARVLHLKADGHAHIIATFASGVECLFFHDGGPGSCSTADGPSSCQADLVLLERRKATAEPEAVPPLLATWRAANQTAHRVSESVCIDANGDSSSDRMLLLVLSIFRSLSDLTSCIPDYSEFVNHAARLGE